MSHLPAGKLPTDILAQLTERMLKTLLGALGHVKVVFEGPPKT